MQHPGHLREFEQAAVALQGVHQAEQLDHQLGAAWGVLESHQLLGDAMQGIACFEDELFEQGIHSVPPGAFRRRRQCASSSSGLIGLTR